MMARLLGAVCASIFVFLSTAPSAALVDNGGGLIFDTVLDITWAQPDSAFITWNEANNLVAGLTLGGVSGWRLPYSSVTAGAGPITNIINCATASEAACRDNEMGYMFYHNLSGTQGSQITTSGDPDLALFPTLRDSIYWTGTEFDSSNVWFFDFLVGNQSNFFKGDSWVSWAVHDGNVVPIPASVWLFSSGLLGLIGIARKKAAASSCDQGIMEVGLS